MTKGIFNVRHFPITEATWLTSRTLTC